MLTIVPRTAAPESVLASALRLAVVRLNRRMRAQRVDSSVTISQLAAMSTLDFHGPLTPGELAAHEKVQPPSMTRVLAGLEEMGLVARRPHPTDGRQVTLPRRGADARGLAVPPRRGAGHGRPGGAAQGGRGDQPDGGIDVRFGASAEA